MGSTTPRSVSFWFLDGITTRCGNVIMAMVYANMIVPFRHSCNWRFQCEPQRLRKIFGSAVDAKINRIFCGIYIYACVVLSSSCI